MPICCGRDCVGNFCPECGRAMSKEAGLRGLLRHVTAEYDRFERKAVEHKGSLDRMTAAVASQAANYSQSYYAQQVKEATVRHRKARHKADQWRDWQECLIRAIDGP